MRRSARTLAVTSVLLAGGLVTSGCTVAARVPVTHGATPTDGAATAAPAARASATATAAPVPTGPVTVARLVAALPPKPAGAKAWAGKGGPSGALTAAQFVTVEFGAKDGAKLLAPEKANGLAFGARRSWKQKGGVLVSVTVADYRDQTGAKASYLDIEGAFEESDAGDTDFTLPGAADSSGIADPTLDEAGNTESDLIVLAGTELLHVVVEAPASVDLATTKAVAQQAYASLCGLSDCTVGSTT